MSEAPVDLPNLSALVDIASDAFERKQARGASILGPAGIGKRRLCEELAQSTRASGIPAAYADAWRFGARRSFSLFAELVRELRTQMGAHDLAALVALTGLPAQIGDPVARVLEAWIAAPLRLPELGGEPAIRSALLWLIEGLVSRGPLALVCGSMQWADDASLRLADDLCQGVVRGPLFVAIAARHELGERHPELFPSSTRLVLDRERSSESYDLVVRTRLAGVGPEHREALAWLAVLGRPFDATFLGAIGQRAGLLDTLAKDHWIERSSGSRARWRLSSETVRETILDSLALERQPAMHERVARHLAGVAGADPEEIAEQLARARRPIEAASWFEAAALERAQVGDESGAVRASEQALSLAPKHSFALLEVASRALASGGKNAQAEALLPALRAQATTNEEMLRARTCEGLVARQNGRVRKAASVFRELHDAAVAADDPGLSLETLYRFVDVAWCYPRALDTATRLADRFVERFGTTPEAMSPKLISVRAKTAWGIGRLDEAYETFLRSAARHRELGSEESAIWPESAAANVAGQLGDYERSAPLLVEQARVQRRSATTGWRITLAAAADAELRLGRIDEARRTFASLAPANASLQELDAIALTGARIDLARGDPEGALRRLSTLTVGERDYLEALSCALRADAYRAKGDVSTALRLSKRALELRNDLGHLPDDDGDVLLARFRALCAADRKDQAAEVLTAAVRAIDERARRIVDPTWRRHFLERVPAHRELLSAARR